MRVAICMSGMPRQVREGHYFTKKNILSHYDCDVFAHTWNGFGREWPEHRECDPSDLVQKLYQPKHFVTQDPMTFTGLGTSQSMWYSIHASNELKRHYEVENGFIYDIVLRSRFDNIFVSKLEFVTPVANCLYGTLKHNRHGCPNEQLDDRFAYGSSEVMDKYAGIKEYVTDDKTSHPSPEANCEITLLEYVRLRGITLVDTEFQCFIGRPVGYGFYPQYDGETILQEARNEPCE